jgi:arsenite methyltransferase
MSTSDTDQIHTAVHEYYAAAARAATQPAPAGPAVEAIGAGRYDQQAAQSLPEAALAASLGCGNPTALADLKPGQTVLDLGSGGGIDVLLSARRVGPTGKAYGLDLTPEMLDLARHNQREAGINNVEFLHGAIEDIPLPDASIDVIISNCVINLSVDKDRVLREAYRVLRPGGRLAISDIVLRRPLPEPLNNLVALWAGCVTGALLDADYRAKLHAAGFAAIDIQTTHVFDRADITRIADDPTITAAIPPGIDPQTTIAALDGAITSAFVRARKPRA